MLKTIFPSNFSILPMRVKPLDSAHKPYFGLNSATYQKDSVHFSGGSQLSPEGKATFCEYVRRHPNQGMTKQGYMCKMRDDFLNDPTHNITSLDRDILKNIQPKTLVKWTNAIDKKFTSTTVIPLTSGRVPTQLKQAFLKYCDQHPVKDTEGKTKLQYLESLGETRKAFVKSIRDDEILVSRFSDTDLDRLLSLQEETLNTWIEEREI